jgi:molybdopterin-guanine dinucleotide biosynthesis protein A
MLRPNRVGIFVGGAARRMGGAPKGLSPSLEDPREPIVVRLARLALVAHPEADVVLVGRHPAYDPLGLRAIDDDPPNVGPLGGLRALLRDADRDGRDVIALACDLPRVTVPILERLTPPSRACAAAMPRPNGIWQPFCAWYRVPHVLPILERVLANQGCSLKELIEALGDSVVDLALSHDDCDRLRDWDTPEDAARDRNEGP